MTIELKCSRCGFRAVVTSRMFAEYVESHRRFGTKPQDRRVLWPFLCHNRWMTAEVRGGLDKPTAMP